MTTTKLFAAFAGLFAAAVLPAVAVAQSLPTGVWIDHTGRGAVEITECNGALCGHIVWVKDANHGNTCRNQVIGDVRPVRNNTWDRGWIVDPDDNSRYSVELKPIGKDRLLVVGYMGTKLLSETMTWKRAPADLKRCDGKEPAMQAAAPAAAPDAVPATVLPVQAQPRALDPDTAAPSQRLVAAPVPISPSAMTPAPERQVAAPRRASAAATRRSKQAAKVYVAKPESRPRRYASAKTKSSQCRLDLPYITLKYPCAIF